MSVDISKEIEKIKHAVYGEDVRTAIAGAMQKMSNGVGISDNVKTALLNIINHIAYTNSNGQIYYNALYAALNESGGGGEDPVPTPDSYPRLEAVYDASLPSTITVDKSALTKLAGYIQTGAGKITAQANTMLAYFECLPNTEYTVNKVLSARYRIGYTTVLPANDVTVSGIVADNAATSLALTTGSNARYVVVYYYDGANDTLSESDIYNSLEITYTSDAVHVIYTDDALDTVKPYLTVKYYESQDSAGTVIPSSNYNLSGVLTEGLSTVVVSYNGLTKSVAINGVIDYYNKWEWKFSSGDLLVDNKSWNSLVDRKLRFYKDSTTSNYPRKAAYVNKGIIPLYNANDNVYYENAYPVPIPINATSVVCSITPSTLKIGIQAFVCINEGYDAISNISGWQVGSASLTFEPGENHFMIITINKDNAQFPVGEPSEIRVQFT